MRLSALAALSALSLLASPAVACDFFSEDGKTLEWIEHDDYSFMVTGVDGSVRLCLVLRSPERTTGACDDGSESDMARDHGTDGAELMYFDHTVWRLCQPGFTLTERKTEY